MPVMLSQSRDATKPVEGRISAVDIINLYWRANSFKREQYFGNSKSSSMFCPEKQAKGDSV
jgi:hypothetical protein